MPNSPDELRVWLSPNELDMLINVARDHSTKHYIAMGFMGRCGLRRSEVLKITPAHVVDTDVATMIRMDAEETKGGYFRSTPVPSSLAESLRAYAELEPDLDGWHDDTTPFIDVSGRTLARWVSKHAQTCNEHTDRSEDGWDHVSPHDLRRGWANRLLEDDVAPPLIMDFGGWKSWPDFRDHYLNGYSSEALRSELEKVNWM